MKSPHTVLPHSWVRKILEWWILLRFPPICSEKLRRNNQYHWRSDKVRRNLWSNQFSKLETKTFEGFLSWKLNIFRYRTIRTNFLGQKSFKFLVADLENLWLLKFILTLSEKLLSLYFGVSKLVGCWINHTPRILLHFWKGLNDLKMC